MAVLSTASAGWQTLAVRSEGDVCVARFDRPQYGNTITRKMVEELRSVVHGCRDTAKILVLEGSPEVFCMGADFREIHDARAHDAREGGQDPEALYDLWLQLASGPFVSIAHVRGKVNAGGIGFVAACDLTLSDAKASFSLSELLFGLMPACVLPFLIQRVGRARANHMTLTTRPINAKQALEWGLIDSCEEDSEALLRKNLLHLRRLSKEGIARYKKYVGGLDAGLQGGRQAAVRANKEVFSDARNLENISRYVRTGRFPWEAAG